MSDDLTARILFAIDSLRTGLAEVVAEMATKADFTGLRADLATKADLAATRAEIMFRIDRLQDRLVAEQNGGETGPAERAERVARDTRDELRKEIAGLVTEIGGIVEQISELTSQLRILQARVDQLEGRLSRDRPLNDPSLGRG